MGTEMIPPSLDNDEEMSERSEEDMAFLIWGGGLCQLRAPNFGLQNREIRRMNYRLRERAICV